MSLSPWRAAAGLVVAAALLTACSSHTISEDPPPPKQAGSAPAPSGWQRLPDLPLSARYDETTAVVGDEVLAIGGSDRTFSGGPLALPTLRDGAALDLTTRTWHKIANAPFAPSRGGGAQVVLGHRLLLARNGPGTWALYDAGTDTWTTVPSPPQQLSQPTLAAIGNRVYALDLYEEESPAPVQVLDLTTRRWTTLPAGPHTAASNDERQLVAAGDQLVMLAGKPAVADVWDGTRWTRYASKDAAGMAWQWTGSAIMSTYRVTQHHSSRGGDYKFPASEFDPVTHTWRRLPWLPAVSNGFLDGGLLDAGTGPLAVTQGYLYDDTDRTSTLVKAPSQWQSNTGALTDDAIVAISGVREKPGSPPGGRITQIEISNQTWLLQLR